LAVSSFVSLFLAAGLVLGYFFTHLCCDKFLRTGKIDSLVLGFAGWKVHLHHWVMGILLFTAAYFMGILTIMPNFLIGVLGGIIIHDFYTDEIWYRVVYKEKK